MRFAETIRNVHPGAKEIALFFIAQAGFCIKTSTGKRIFIDPYLSNACERLFGFKRMIPAVLGAEEVEADLYLVTHHHADHLDPDTMPVVVKNPSTMFIIAPDCKALLDELGLPTERYRVLRDGDDFHTDEISIRAIYADHGDLAPEAVGYFIEVDGIRIYHAGDTALRVQEILASLKSPIDILIAPINGQYGNMNVEEACNLALEIKPKIVIPSHYWMFLEHVSENGAGDPATFLKEASRFPENIKAKVMAPGEHFIYSNTKASVA